MKRQMSIATLKGSFEKRECCKFVAKDLENKPDICVCGRNRSECDANAQLYYPQQEQEGNSWTKYGNTCKTKTDVMGEMEFLNTRKANIAKFIRCHDETRAEDLYRLMTQAWKVTPPKLLISVTGGALDFNINAKQRMVLRQGLVKLAKSTGAWVVTGGTNAGVMKLVGSALRDYPSKDRTVIPTIGIVTWGIVANRELLKNSETSEKGLAKYPMPRPDEKVKGVPLDPNHNYFILVDDGTVNQFGKEISTRVNFEKHISTVSMDEEDSIGGSSNVPSVVILLEGGPNSLQTVYESISLKNPVVIVQGTGRAADLIASYYKFQRIKKDKDGNEVYSIDDHNVQELKRRMLLENQSQWSRLTDQQRNAECEKRIKQCEEICSKKYSQYVSIFDIDDESTDLDSAILEALLRSISGAHVSVEELQQQLMLAFQWDRLDIAEKYIFNKKTNFPRQFIKNVMRKAILNCQTGFIGLLMRDLKLNEYVNINEVFDVYKEASTHKIVKRFIRSPTSTKLKAKNFSGIVDRLCKIIGNYFEINWVNHRVYGDYYKRKELPGEVSEEDIPKPGDPAFFFYILAILMLNQEMAEFFLCQCKDALSSGLIGMKLCQCLIDSSFDLTPDEEENVEEICESLEEITIKLFNIMYEEDEHEAARVLLSPLSISHNHTVIGLAQLADHKKFIAHPLCQMVLKSAWSGALIHQSHMDILVVISILCPFLNLFLFDYHAVPHKDGAYYLLNMPDKVEEEFELVGKTRGSDAITLGSTSPKIHQNISLTSELRKRMEEQPIRSVESRMKGFYDAPITKFWISSIFFLIFVGLLTYNIIAVLPKYPNVAEILLVGYMVFYTIAEGREMVSGSHGILRNALIWSDDGWNRLDFMIIMLFWGGFGLRWTSLRDLARLLYIFDCFAAYMRILFIFTINRRLGSYISVVFSTIPAVLEFTVVWIVFMLSFGIGQYAILYPQEEPRPYSILNVIYYPYWQTYGELHLSDAEKVVNESSTCTGPDCPYLPEIGIMFLIGYTVAGNIVLLNLLIAVFNNIYEDIRDKADLLYWSNLLEAVEEFNKPLLPPIIMEISVLFRKIFKIDTSKINRSIVSTEGQPTMFINEIMLFQAHCSDCYLIDKDKEKSANTDAKINYLTSKLAETQATVYQIKEKFDHKLQSLESGIAEILEILKPRQ